MAGAAAPDGCGGAVGLRARAVTTALAIVTAARSSGARALPAADPLNTRKDATDPAIRDYLVRDFKSELRVGWFF
jgi:hypothetical protein